MRGTYVHVMSHSYFRIIAFLFIIIKVVHIREYILWQDLSCPATSSTSTSLWLFCSPERIFLHLHLNLHLLQMILFQTLFPPFLFSILLSELPMFADYYRQLGEADMPFAKQCMAHWRRFLMGPPNKPNEDVYGLLDVRTPVCSSVFVFLTCN